MGVACAPACEKNFAFIGYVITIGIFKKKSIWGLMHNDAAVCENQTRGNTKLVCKGCEFICNIVAVGIFADNNLISALALGLKFVGVINGECDP